MPPIRLKKMLFMVHCDFEKLSENQHFKSREGGVTKKKSTLCTIMLTILDDP